MKTQLACSESQNFAIPRVTRAEFNERGFLQQGGPVIITDALHEWRIAERWTPEYLMNVARDRPVKLSTCSDGDFRVDLSEIRRFDQTEVDFGTAAQRMLEDDANNHAYVMQQSIPDQLPELFDNLVVPEWISDCRMSINLWFGRRTSSQLHFDHSNNLFAQLHGSKEFTLFAPDETPHLYPYHHDVWTAHLSKVEPDRPDLEVHPDFVRAKALRFRIQAGELLFMPAFWWHFVRAPGVSVSVNFWWDPSLAQWLGASNATRMLPSLYAEDRLERFRQESLAPSGLDFITAGERFLDHGRTWGAALFAVVALNAWGRRYLTEDGAEPAPGSSLASLAAELQTVCTALLADSTLPPAHRWAIQDSAALATLIARSHDDAQVERKRVEALFDALRACEAQFSVLTA